eukprot:Em0016g394a
MVAGSQRQQRIKDSVEKRLEVSKHLDLEERKFALHDGPFVKGLEEALQSFNVHRQHYFGGVFVSHHIHKTLQPENIKRLYTSMQQQSALHL